MTSRCAVVVGSSGQDGYYLSKQLIQSGYRVIGINRSGITGPPNTRPFDILSNSSVANLIANERPAEVYYLAAYHHSSDEITGALAPLLRQSFDVHCQGLINFLDAIASRSPDTRLFYAASSLVFGEPAESPQNENTPMVPICAYGITKSLGIEICRLYRREMNIRCCSGILYNHESPRRDARFVSQKIARAVADIHKGRSSKLVLGDLEAKVDWSFAGDAVRAMHAMLQNDDPQDLIIASGKLHSIRDFVSKAFAVAGMDYRSYVEQSSSVLPRPARRLPLHGDPSRLKALSGWQPEVPFDALVAMMVENALAAEQPQ
jgi:GDPmannose 4,6-dehydratase